MKFLFVRHGELAGDPFATPARPVSGCLSARGVRQARGVAAALKNEKIDLVIASPYGRALQTAEIAVAGRDIPFALEPGLVEWNPDRSLEKLPPTDFEAIRNANTGLYPEDEWKTALGEGCFDMYARIVPATVAALGRAGIHMRFGGFVPDPGCENKCVAFFAHGGSLNVLLAFLLKMPPFPVGSFSFPHCGIARMVFSEHKGIYYPALQFDAPAEREEDCK